MDGASIALSMLTILGSGVVSSVVTSRLNRGRDQTVFMRAKAEQLYLSADEYGRLFGATMVSYFPLLEGRIDWNQMLDVQIKNGEKQAVHGGAETMTMLVAIYFPSVRTTLMHVWSAREHFNALISELKRDYIANGYVTGDDWKTRFMSVAETMDAAIKDLQKQIVAAAREHAGVRQG